MEKHKIDISGFAKNDFIQELKKLFKNLKIPINHITDDSISAQKVLTDTYQDNENFNLIKDIYFVGSVDEAAFAEKESALKIEPDGKHFLEVKDNYEGILVFGVLLKNRKNNLLPTRSCLAQIARAFNREFNYTPVILIFKYADSKENYLTFAHTMRLKYKQEWREGEKAGKVSLVRDINIKDPHAGHIRIIKNLNPKTCGTEINSFAKLYDYWQEVLSVSILNKNFYKELSNWYFWAVEKASFPMQPDKSQEENNSVNIIRLLTRLLFVWFIKEKQLIPEKIFDIKYLKEQFKEFSPDNKNNTEDAKSVYYKAILQNLFFASLNCPVKPEKTGDKRERGFRADSCNFGVTYLMRYKDQFKNPEEFLQLINNTVPFLNGGLFECLDIRGEKEKKEDRRYIDGFSDNLPKEFKLILPDYLFFGDEQKTDLSAVIGKKTKEFKQANVKGIIHILKSYKFTIAENTPVEEDIALDPELLGKVFENLLATYNPETKTTARNQTGSFYTPKEIVNYMAEESIIAHLKNKLLESLSEIPEKLEEKLRELLSYENENAPLFTKDKEKEKIIKKEIIKALDNCKILDPACGSGAFPMGILQKTVHILQKIDPTNYYWKEAQKAKAGKDAKDVFSSENIKDKKARDEKLKEINKAFDDTINAPDYARKLFLIENCIYGVDIQPIAVQISKLRFFISLVVDQKVDKGKDNFGIIALPNLETKFVAANTLIGIEKPATYKNIFNNDEMKQLEQELKNIRHKLFSAKTPSTKAKLKKEDKEIREKIKTLLEKLGWDNETTARLSLWDPYDQNASSPFFDSQWMFGIKEGFDIVIGNPPYVDSEAMVKIFPMLREQLKKNYITTKGNWDIYIPFYEKAYSLIKRNGFLAYITPNKWLSAPYGKKLRDYFQNEIYKVIDCSKINVFEAGNSPVVCFLKKHNKNNHIIINEFSLQWDLLFRSNYEKKKLSIDNWGLLLSPYISIISKINKKKKILGSYYIVENPFSTSEAYQLKDIVKDSMKHFDTFKLLTTGGIDPYESLWGKKKTSYLKSKYDFPIIKKSNLKKLLPKRFYQQNCKKIILSGMRHFETFFDKNSEYLASKSTIIIKNIDNYAGYFLTGILNSKLIKFYIKESYSALGIDGGINFSKEMVHNLPVILVQKLLDPIATISSINHFLTGLKYSYNLFENIIDGLVFELYFPDHMKQRQIDIMQFVEEDIKEVIQDKDFNMLPDAQKEKAIKILNAKWTDPQSEIVKRINSFAEKSPDILKPIITGK